MQLCTSRNQNFLGSACGVLDNKVLETGTVTIPDTWDAALSGHSSPLFVILRGQDGGGVEAACPAKIRWGMSAVGVPLS